MNGSDEAVEATVATLLGLDASWAVGYALGLVVILLFARDQLNQKLEGETGERRLARIIAMFPPSHLRSGSVFFKAYVLYVALLAVIYTLLSLGGASVLKLVSGAGSGEATLEGASAPLLVALTMVGLAPRTPLFSRVERHFRALAHRAVGIPSNFNEFTEALHGVVIDVDSLDDDLLGGADAERLRKVLARARAVFGEGGAGDSFAQGAVKLFAYRAWQGGQPAWPSWTVRSEFQRFESELAPVVQAVVEDLEDLADRDAATASDQAEGADALQRRLAAESRWRSLAERVQAAAEDVCALFALYAERAESLPQKDDPVSTLLRRLIAKAEARRTAVAPQVDIVTARLVLLALMMFLIGAVGHAIDINPIQGASWAKAGVLWAFGVLVLYGPASLVALMLRQSAVARERWRNAFDRDDVFPTIQYGQLFAVCWVVSAAMMLGYVLLILMLGHLDAVRAGLSEPDFEAVVERFLTGSAMRLSPAATSLLFAVSGAVHGVLIGLLADAAEICRTRAEIGRGRLRTGLVFSHGAALGLIALSILNWNGTWAIAERNDRLVESAETLAAQHAARFAEDGAEVEVAVADAAGAAPPPAVWTEPRADEDSALVIRAALDAAAAARWRHGIDDPEFGRAVGRDAALKVAAAAVRDDPTMLNAATASMVLVDAAKADDIEALRAEIRRAAAGRDAVTFSARASVLYQSWSSAAFGWLTAIIMLRPLSRLADRKREADVAVA